MKKRTENLLLSASIAAAVGATYCADNKVVKVIASGLALVGGGMLIFRNGKTILKETIEEVNHECDETERIIEESGINVDLLDDDNLSNHEDGANDGSINTKILFRQAREIFSDDELESCSMNEHALHVLQRNKKLVFAIQMPKSQAPESRKKTKKDIGSMSLRSQDVYLFFKEEFTDYAGSEEIGIKSGIKIYQTGLARVIVNNKLCYEPIERLEGEETREYVKRVNSIIETWESLESYRRERVEEYESRGKELKGYENFMFIEFPVQRDGDILPGMTVTKTMWLIQELMDTYFEIDNNKLGIRQKFEFSHIMFHPGEDLAELYAWDVEDGKLEIVHL